MTTKKQKALTTEEKFQLDLQTEVELARLQRQYRILERDRNSYTEQSSGKLGKQKKVIRILKKEHHEILTDLDVADSEANAKRDAKIVENLNNLLQEHNDFQGDIKHEKAYLNELDMQISIVMKKIIEVKATQVTEVQEQQRTLDAEKTLQGLENKLDTAIKRFCMTLTENRKLREEIDHLLKERTQFNKMWEKLIKNLSHGKKFMLDLIEQATIAYDQREEWCQKLQALRNRAHADFMIHAQEMREMERKIDDEHKLKDFLCIKGQKRIMRDLMDKEYKKREKQRQEMEVLLEHYRDLLEEIKEFMGESNIHGVAEKFSEIEIENFGNFQYINAINQELEARSDEVMHLHLEIDEQRRLNQIRTYEQEECIKSLEQELEDSFQEAENAEKRLAQTENTLALTLSGIDKLFKICKCNNDPLLELLGDNSTINNYNALLYLNILENKISEVIIGVYFKEKVYEKKRTKDLIIREDKIKNALLPLEKIVPRNPCPLCVEQTQVSDVIDSLQFVLNKKEVKIKLNETLQIPGIADVVHTVSACHLPKSREIIQRRYQ